MEENIKVEIRDLIKTSDGHSVLSYLLGRLSGGNELISVDVFKEALEECQIEPMEADLDE